MNHREVNSLIEMLENKLSPVYQPDRNLTLKEFQILDVLLALKSFKRMKDSLKQFENLLDENT